MDWSPLWLSLKVAGWATVFSVLLGLPPAYLLGRRRFPGHSLLAGATLLPLVLPPTVLGYALLVALGRRGPVGAWLDRVHHPLVFTWQGAVCAACLASLPLFVSQARVALEAVDADVVGAARTDGAGFFQTLRFVLLPLARPGLVAGTTLAFARALGDFGATLMVAGDTPGPDPDPAAGDLRRRFVRRHAHRRYLFRPFRRPVPDRVRPRRPAGGAQVSRASCGQELSVG